MKLKRHSLAEQAYQTLLKQIISGKRPAGEKLTEDRICELFDISRTPAREALVKLERDGMVERQPRCGWHVSAPAPDQVRELFECRREIECLALRDAIDKIPESELIELRNLLNNTSEDSKRRSLYGDDKLHSMIAEYCGNRYLTEILDKLCKQTAPYRFYRTDSTDPEPLLQERLELVEAMIDRDTESAVAKLWKHISHGSNMFR
jgi:DNA-binding GntR family transcriptional regulator